MSLVSYDDLIQPMADDATLVVERALARMKNVSMPMPPSPNAAATTGEIAILESWIAAGLPPGDCGGGGPFDTPPTCSSGVMWTGGDSESELMHPGAACISCHGSEMQIAGTVYPTAHEPTECNGAGNAVVEVTDANATVFALPVNSAGNFYYDGVDQVVFPITAKVIVGGAERVMMSAQTSGDCNECHTQTGTNMAPGRIVLP